jgi:leucyl aminopeptidase
MPSIIEVRHGAPGAAEADVIAVGVRTGRLDTDAPGLDLSLASLVGFSGKVGETLAAVTDAGARLLVGLGDAPDPSSFRRIGAAVAKASRRSSSVSVDLLGGLQGRDRTEGASALAQGLVLGAYRFDRYHDADPADRLAEAVVTGAGAKRVADAVGRGVRIADAIVLVRDLVNTPGGDLTPSAFAEQARTVGEAAGLEVEILDRPAIVEARLGGLLGVSRGSAQEPRYLRITYRPAGRPKGRIALVGKGVTFDAGGLSIKSSAGMEAMKGDMAGAATVLAALSLVPIMAPRLEVTAHLPLTDNMLGPDATRVGDVLRMRNGTTVEVLNTDAEGRLILADALAWAAEDEPDAIIDLATLTGACMVALGDRTAGVFGDHQGLRDRVLDAGAAEGEAFWALPMPAHLRSGLDSEMADLRNIGQGPYGGASTAAIFLREFVGQVPWVHIDLAGPSATKAAWDEQAKGGTGFGVRTLVHLLATWTKLPA